MDVVAAGAGAGVKNRTEPQGSQLAGSTEAMRPPVTLSSPRVVREKVVEMTPRLGDARLTQWKVSETGTKRTGKMTSKLGGEEVGRGRAEGKGDQGLEVTDRSQGRAGVSERRVIPAECWEARFQG